MHITTKVVRSNPAHGDVNSIQLYVIKFLSDLLAAGRWFSPGTPISSTNKTDRHDITEIVLKVALNTITLIITPLCILRTRLNTIETVMLNSYNVFTA